MKLIELLEARFSIHSLSKEKMPVKLAYRFTKFLKETNTEEDFYKEKLQEILLKYGEKDENGNYVVTPTGRKIREDAKDECFAAVVELESTEVDKPDISFTINELGELKMSPETMNSLFAFIKEEE